MTDNSGAPKGSLASVSSMHSDAKLAPKLDGAIVAMREFLPMFRCGYVTSLIEATIELLEVARFIRSDEQLQQVVSGWVEQMTELEAYFNLLPVPAPDSREALGNLASRQRQAHDSDKAALQQTVATLNGELRQTTEELERLRHQDRQHLNRLASMLGGTTARLRQAMGEQRSDFELSERLARLTVERQELERRLGQQERAAIDEQAESISGLLTRYERLVMALAPPESSKDLVVSPAVDLPGLAQEILRRREWLQRLSERQEEAEALRESLQEAVDGLPEALRFGSGEDGPALRQQQAALARQIDSISSFISRLVATATDGQTVLKRLQRFQDACLTVEQGMPSELSEWRAQDLPQIPPLPPVNGEELPTEDLADGQADSSLPQRQALERIALKHQLPPKAVFIISLYELLPKPSESKGSRNKGLVAVCTSARDVGLLARYGWSNVHQLLHGWHGQEAVSALADYLRYGGSVSNRPVYRRTQQSLPWQPEVLFTAAEIADYQAHLAANRWKKPTA